ncbi:MAG: hypothetical protein IT373_12600, partial [Polyangiaceae bacterium]|nr:hypothetical protein [Polyangiaceae bacterium]
PIEKVERSLMILASTVHGRPPSELLAPAERARFLAASPRLGPVDEGPEARTDG